MSKLYSLREWYTLADSAKRLTSTLAEEITTADVLHLLAERILPVSWIMQHQPAVEVAAACGAHFPGTDLYQLTEGLAKEKKQPFGDPAYVYTGMSWEQQSKWIVHLDGVFTLEMDEGGASDYILSHVTGRGGELYSLDGTIVRDKFGVAFQLLEEFDERSLSSWQTKPRMDDVARYYPSSKLPRKEEIVLTRGDLERFETSLVSEPEKSLSSRERETLLKLIATMAKEGYKHNPMNKAQSAVSEIMADAQRAGLSISDQTIRDKLKDAWELLPGNPHEI